MMDEVIYDWSDERCIAIAAKNYFPISVLNVDVQKNIINKFLNFYLGGRIQNGMTVSDLIFAVISIMPSSSNTETFIWNESQYKSNGTLFFLSPEDRLNSEYMLIKNKHSTEANIDDAELINVQCEDDLTSLLETDGDFNQFICDLIEHEQIKISTEANEHDAESKNLQFEDDLTSSLEIDADDLNQFTYDDIEHEQIKKSENEIMRREHKQMKNKALVEANVHDVESINTINIDLNLEHASSMWINDYKIRKKANERINKKTVETLLPQLSSATLNKRAKNIKQDVSLIEYGPVENAAFITSCNNLLDDWDSNPNARMVLKYMFGVIALTLMRATTKSRKHLMNTFSSPKFINILSHYNISTKFAPPHVRCIKSCCKHFIKKECNVRIMFAKMASSENYLFRATVLAHTANYKMGIFTMLQNIIEVYSYNIFVNVTLCTETAESWRKIISFMKFLKKKQETGNQRTFHWARIIDSDSFQHLNCADNYALAVIMAVFQHRINGDEGVWQSAWITGTDENLDVYITLGMKMYDKYIEEEKKEMLNKVPA